MLNINRTDVEQIIKIIEYILDKEDKVTVDQLMKDNGLTFEEYRLMSALAMPAIRRKNDLGRVKSKGAYYKGMYIREKHERERLEDALKMAHDYLNRYFKEDTKNESNVHILAGGEGTDAVQASGSGDDWEEGHPEEWAI
jgi:hypothetical protein